MDADDDESDESVADPSRDTDTDAPVEEDHDFVDDDDGGGGGDDDDDGDWPL